MHSPIGEVLIYLAAMIAVVPICKWLGLGAVLGYLLAGALLGPSISGLIAGSQADAAHLAEFGVIMMLFMIGLELNPKKLWQMRGPIFGLGGSQVLVTSVVFGALLLIAGWSDLRASAALGMILALSSTAVVLQCLHEKGHAHSVTGQNAFAVLLFQDIAVIPMLAVLPLMAISKPGLQSTVESSAAGGPLATILALGGLVFAGRFLVRPIFRLIARQELNELLTAAALMIVIGTTALMQRVGLSPALGAFLAGVLLADTEFRHQIEADLDPFKGLLLGLFFISIGAGIDLAVLVERPGTVMAGVLGLITVKLCVIWILTKLFKIGSEHGWLTAVSLSQGGEFAFVLLQMVSSQGIIDQPQSQLTSVVVALSMAIAPLMINLAIRYPLFVKQGSEKSSPSQENLPQDNQVLVLGIGRFGQVILRMLRANGFTATALDFDADQIRVMEKFGIKSYFGDARRMDLLVAAGIEQASAVVIAIDDKVSSEEILKEIRQRFAKMPVFVRAFDRVHAYRLLNDGATEVIIETGGSAALLGAEVLRSLGYAGWRAHRQASKFILHTQRSIRDLAAVFGRSDQKSFFREAQLKSATLQSVLADDSIKGAEPDREWESAPRKAT
jgi:monovalent cation:proton antiporter-2 (CPA2) family protein